MIDVKLSQAGVMRAKLLRQKIGTLDIIYHDGLSRCEDTGRLLKPNVLVSDKGPSPWRMGFIFEGNEIDEDSLMAAKMFIKGNVRPPGGDRFSTWAGRWSRWIRSLSTGFAACGVVTHNRNIQYLYASQHDGFSYQMYDCDGPDFCSVHFYDQRTGLIAPWGGKNVPMGIYLIRHGDTEWGT